MPKRYGPKKRAYAKKKSAPRRRLQPAVALAGAAVAVGKRIYKRRQAVRSAAGAVARSNFRNRLENSDNITTAKAIVIGKQKPISFQEQVSRSIRPPLLFKRNYAFSAESASGRKGMFSMEVNVMNNSDLQNDLIGYKSSLTTDTAFASGIQSVANARDGSRYYVDKHVEKIQMVNSSTNSITGKIHLIAYKRDTTGTYDSGVIVNPINMLMYYSTFAPAALTTGVGGEQTVGNGWVFESTGTVSNYAVSHQMPGSSLNASGVCAIMDSTLSFSSPHVKEGWNYWFRKVSSSNFSLKPGQQFNTSFVFNDLPTIDREEQQYYIHVAGVSYSIVVEFQAGIVGDSTALSDAVSIGTGQLSVVRENTRILGMKNSLRSKIILQTSPLATIAASAQQTINPDTGVVDAGAEFDA